MGKGLEKFFGVISVTVCVNGQAEAARVQIRGEAAVNTRADSIVWQEVQSAIGVSNGLIKRALVVGYGSIGRRHLRLARGILPDADIRVWRHRAGSSIPDNATECIFSVERAVEFAPQIAVIATPATFHLDAAQPLAEVGAHLLIEKPISAALDGVGLLLETCRARDRVVLIGYNLRFARSLQRFRNCLREGLIGRVLSIRCEVGQYLPTWRPGGDYRQGVSAKRDLGGGVLLELSHEIDYLRWIFGEIDWVQASISRQSDLEINVEDTAHLILGFSAGDNGHRLIGNLSMDMVRQDATRLCTAIGERGSLRWNGLADAVELIAAGAKEWQEIYRCEPDPDESYLAEWRHFLACVSRQERPSITGEDGLKILQVIETAREASDVRYRLRVPNVKASGTDRK